MNPKNLVIAGSSLLILGSLAVIIFPIGYSPRKTQPPPPSPITKYYEPSTPSNSEPTPAASPSSSPVDRTSQNWVTTDQAIAATSEQALDQATTHAAQGDSEAFQQLMDSGQVFEMNPNIKVQLVGCIGVTCDRVKIRIVGKSDTLYATRKSIKQE